MHSRSAFIWPLVETFARATVLLADIRAHAVLPHDEHLIVAAQPLLTNSAAAAARMVLAGSCNISKLALHPQQSAAWLCVPIQTLRWVHTSQCLGNQHSISGDMSILICCIFLTNIGS